MIKPNSMVFIDELELIYCRAKTAFFQSQFSRYIRRFQTAVIMSLAAFAIAESMASAAEADRPIRQASDSAQELRRDTLYWHYPHNAPQGGTPAGAIREGDWKLIEFFNDDRIELYNLAEDIGEKFDLVTSKPEIAERLHRKLKVWRKSVDAKMPPKS